MLFDCRIYGLQGTMGWTGTTLVTSSGWIRGESMANGQAVHQVLQSSSSQHSQESFTCGTVGHAPFGSQLNLHRSCRLVLGYTTNNSFDIPSIRVFSGLTYNSDKFNDNFRDLEQIDDWEKICGMEVSQVKQQYHRRSWHFESAPSGRGQPPVTSW